VSIQKIIYENAKYNILKIQESLDYTMPTLINTAYIKDSVVMPKCKYHVVLSDLDIPSVINACKTTGYIALIREEYRHNSLKKGCVAHILDFIVDDDNEEVKLYVKGITRFLSYQEATMTQSPYEMIKPDFCAFKNDNTGNSVSVDVAQLDPIFIHFFLLFIGELNIDTHIDMNALSLDTFINSLITMIPICDMEKMYLSEIPSLKKRQEALALILNCQFNGLTTSPKYH
jgi:Lon protease-like protein